MDHLLVLGLRVWPESAGGSSPWFLLWLGSFLPTIEALLHWVKDLLADILYHLHIAWVHARCSPQLLHLIVHLPKLLSSHLRPNEFDGGRLHPRSCLGEADHQPNQMALSCSFCPVTLAWENILYSRNRWCNPWGSHLGYSSRNTLVSRCLSDRNACFLGQLLGSCCFGCLTFIF